MLFTKELVEGRTGVPKESEARDDKNYRKYLDEDPFFAFVKTPRVRKKKLTSGGKCGTVGETIERGNEERRKEMKEIDISKYDKAEVLAALYNNSQPLGMGFLHFAPKLMTKEEAAVLLEERTYFDYLEGRVMKVDLSGNVLAPYLYDRDNGEGAAREVISRLAPAV